MSISYRTRTTRYYCYVTYSYYPLLLLYVTRQTPIDVISSARATDRRDGAYKLAGLAGAFPGFACLNPEIQLGKARRPGTQAYLIRVSPRPS